jgi:hypothetical protein
MERFLWQLIQNQRQLREKLIVIINTYWKNLMAFNKNSNNNIKRMKRCKLKGQV